MKLSLSGMGGEVTLKLPFILGNIDTDTSLSVDKENQTIEASTNDLHLNDHQMLNEIRRPVYERNDNDVDNEMKKDNQTSSKTNINSSKSLDVYDDLERSLTLNNEGIDFINKKFSEMNRRHSNQSSDSSSISDQDDLENEKQETNVIAQVHCQKYLESDI